MTDSRLDEEEIFHVARTMEDPEIRSKYLGQVCAGDQPLRDRVEALLNIDEKEHEFLRSNPGLRPTVDQPSISEAPGHQIGRYKLLQRIGEGGFGVVYMAEQRQPVRRKVALKIIRPGMDTEQVVIRFEAERQALALMDHPNIARVLDAGATESGRPYFVMELVKGVPITDYCDKNQLPTDKRLELFITVCQAVQHAHQKGVIHRDLKPRNIMVTLHDGQPVVKVIDFGISKAINQQLTEKTLFTAYGQMVGTPQYMSPEQAEMSGLDVDTRADVYSLGVLLYELLTGTTPLESERLRTAGYAEMQRIICEEQPPKPSTRLSTSSDELTTVAKHRGMSPERLHKTIRGDLDWIVMKALEKDRSRRYETASGFADDVRRHLHGEPVTACPPSASYRLRKFASRNKGSLVAITIVAASLILGFVATWSQAKRANARAAALQQTLTELRDELIDKAIILAWSGQESAAAHYIEKAVAARASEDWGPFIRGLTNYYRGDMSQALSHFQAAVALDSNSVCARAMQAPAELFSGRSDEYRRLAHGLRNLAPRDDYSAYDQLFLAYAILYEDSAESASRAKEVVKQRGHWGLGHVIRAEALAHLALDTGNRSHIEEAIAEIQKVETRLGDNPVALVTNLSIHLIAIRLGAEEGESVPDNLRRRADELARHLSDCDYPISRGSRAVYYELFTNEHDKARDEWRQCLNSDLLRNHFAAVLCYHGELDEADFVTQRDGPMTQVARAYVLTARADDQAQIHREIGKLTDKSNRADVRSSALPILLLLGDLPEAKRLARDLLHRPDRLSAERTTVQFAAEKALVQFVADENEDNLLAASKGSRKRLCDARFLIAMRHLGLGHRDDARREFTACCLTDQINRDSFYWARAFLKMLNDENWPPRATVVEKNL